MTTKTNNKFPFLYLFLGGLLFVGANSYAATSESEGTSQGTFPEVREAAREELKPHIGLQLGVAEPGEDHDAAAQYGVEFGYQPYVPLALAIEANYFASDSDSNNDGDLTRTTIIGKGTYNFGGSTPIIRHSFIGGGLGAVVDTEGANETNAGFKALAGFDIPLSRTGLAKSKSFTLGATASYLSVINARDTFALNGQLKYWF